MTTPNINVEFPKFNPRQGGIPLTCKRTLREGGFMLFQEDLNEKHVIHNYGYGGAQFSLSFGSAYLANKMLTMRQHPTEIHEVAVLGAGISGLLLCLELLKTGYKVSLYSQSFPKFNEENQRGLQFWYPSFYHNQDPVKHEFICKIAYRLYKECLDQKKYLSIKWVNCFISGPQAQTVSEMVSEFITKDIKPVKLSFENGVEEQFVCFRTFLIDTDLFMEEIMTELKLRKINMVTRKFKDLQDVATLKEKSVYNCLGLGARQVFGDKAVSSMIGHYIKFPLKQRAKENFIIWSSKDDQLQEDVIITVSGKTAQLGSSWSKDESKRTINQQTINKICMRAEQYIAQRQNRTKKL